MLALGSSSESVAVAERWQFSAGEGPNVDSSAGSTVLMATQAVMDRNWPVLTRHLMEKTGFRSLCAVHVPQVGLLLVYFADPEACLLMNVGHAGAAADVLAVELMTADSWSGWELPAVQLRSQVWIAVGMLVQYLQLMPCDALAVLRAWAFCHRCVDFLARDLASGALTVDQLDR